MSLNCIAIAVSKFYSIHEIMFIYKRWYWIMVKILIFELYLHGKHLNSVKFLCSIR